MPGSVRQASCPSRQGESEVVARASLDVLISGLTGHIIDVRKDDPLALDVDALT